MQVNDLPRYPNSRELTVSDYHLLAPLLKEYPEVISDTNFSNIFAWKYAYKYKLSELNGMIIAHGEYKNLPFFIPPIGDKKKRAETAHKVFELSTDKHIPYLACATNDLIDEMSKIKKIKTTEDRGNWDYMHKSSDLAELPGSKYHAKRNLIKQFTDKHNYQVEELNTSTCREAMEFSDKWCEQRDCESDEGLEKERCAIYQMLSHFEAIRLHGILVRVDGEIVGLTMGEELNSDTYVVHVEKGDQHHRGIYQFINNELAKKVSPKYKWLNREQDLGIDGMRRAKTSYYPDHFIKKYKVEIA